MINILGTVLKGTPLRTILAKKGLTIVELMVGIIIVSVLVLTIGSMLYYTYLSRFRSEDTVEMQRDATIAMDMIARAIRPHTSPEINIADNGAKLLIGGTEEFSTTGTAPRYSLQYDPDNTSPGDEMEIIKERVTTDKPFSKVGAARIVKVEMALENDTDSITMSSTINYRKQES